MKNDLKTLNMDELEKVSGGFSFHISFLDVVTGGLDRVVDYVHGTANNKIEDPKNVEQHATDGINGTPQGDPSDTGNVTLDGNGTPFPGDGD